MKFYQNHITKTARALYPHDYLTSQVMKARQFMDQHFASKLHITDMAGEAFLSKFHFIRLFKSYYGSTPYQYLTSVRIKNAKRLLITNLSIAEVCTEVGFESVTYFTGLFKKMTGITPAAFRESKR